MATFAGVINRFLSAYPESEQQDVNMPEALLNRADVYILQHLPVRWKTFTLSSLVAGTRTYALDATAVKITDLRFFTAPNQYTSLLPRNIDYWDLQYGSWRSLSSDAPTEYAVQPSATASEIWLLAPAPSSTLQVAGATNATPIVVTTAAHGLSDGTQVEIATVTGNTAANGTFYIDVLTTTTFALYSDEARTVPVAGNGAYVSGGYVLATGSPIIRYDARFITPLTSSSNLPDFPFLEELYIQKMCELYAMDQRQWDQAKEHTAVFDRLFPECYSLMVGKADGQYADIRSFEQRAGWGAFRNRNPGGFY